MSKQSEYITEAIQQAAVTLQWQASDATPVGNGYPIGEGGDEYTDEIIAKVPYLTEALTAFIRTNWRDLHTMEAGQCGHDFILTANHHGAGFWDRGLGARGDRLTKASDGYSLDAEFALWGDSADDDHASDEVAYLMVGNEIIVNDLPDDWNGWDN
jgi:hypothetical protein